MNRNANVAAIPTFTGSQFKIDELKKPIRSFSGTMQTQPVIVQANNSVSADMKASQGQYAELWKSSGVAVIDEEEISVPDMLVTVNHPQTNWNLMNRAIHWGCMIGTGVRPHEWYGSTFLFPTQSLVWRFTDFSGSETAVTVQCNGRGFHTEKYQTGRVATDMAEITDVLSRKRSVPFWLTTDRDITQEQSTLFEEFTMTVPYQAHFEVKYITVVSTQPFLWTLRDSWSDEFVHNVRSGAPLDSRISVGTADLPFEFEEPLLIARDNILTLAVQSPDASEEEPNRIFFTLCGRLITDEDLVK